jgi:RHS repeat-associated protein
MGEIYEQLEYTPYGELWVEHLETTIEATPFRFTGKERDGETGLYYYGARYLNPQTSMWLSADPAMEEYIPQAPINDEAKKYNQNLPGMGGVFDVINLHVYHYAGNKPVMLTDPDGNQKGGGIPIHNQKNSLPPTNKQYNTQPAYEGIAQRERHMSNAADTFEAFANNSGRYVVNAWKNLDVWFNKGEYRKEFIQRQNKAIVNAHPLMEEIKNQPRLFTNRSVKDGEKFTMEEARSFANVFNASMLLNYGSDRGKLGPYAEDLLIPQMTENDAYLYLNDTAVRFNHNNPSSKS